MAGVGTLPRPEGCEFAGTGLVRLLVFAGGARAAIAHAGDRHSERPTGKPNYARNPSKHWLE